MNSYYKGIITEYIAIIYLFFHGYKILKRRYKTHYGEVDIVALKDNNIVGIEIKARFNQPITPEYVYNKQRQRILNSLSNFIYKNPKYNKYGINLEIIVFKSFFNFKHFKN